MQADIISEIRKMKGIRDVVVLTHNIDFIFLQTVFLASLKQCGHPSLTIFSDAQCAQETYARQANVIKDLGSRFRVIPVAMNPGFRFHPKAIILSGDSECCLYTGSGNLTFGGLRENGEIWSKYETKDGVVPAEIAALKQYLAAILPYVGLSDEVEKDIADVFQEERHSWAKYLPSANGLWYQPGSDETLLQRMQTKLAGRQVKSIRVCTPYFDPKAKALVSLSTSFGNPPIDVYIQSKRSTLLRSAADMLPDNISIRSLQVKLKDKPSNRFVHAKWYAFDMGDGIELFSGSANCSNAALLIAGNQGNAELMSESTMSSVEFNDAVMSELVVGENCPELIDEIPEDDVSEDELLSLSITGARYDYGQLIVAYRISEQAVVTRLALDDANIELSNDSIANDRIQLVVDARPKRVVLYAKCDGVLITSNTMWVDDESLLRSNSTSRQVIEAIQTVQVGEEDDPKRWIMLFDLLSQNFQHRSSRENSRSVAKDKSSSGSLKLHKDLLISEGYARGLSLPMINLQGIGNSQSIYSLLLSSFGLSGSDQVEDTGAVDDGEDETAVDQPDISHTVKTPKLKVDPTKKQRSRLLELVTSIIDELCQSDFVLVREPEALSRDLQVVGILLRKLYSMGWVDEEKFFNLTHRAWSQLFFSSKDDRTKGLVQIRFEASDDPVKFMAQLVTPGLVASLYGWFSAVRVDVIDAYAYRFILSQLMAMGRCPWLWHLDEANQQQAMQQLSRIWLDSPCPDQGSIALDEQMSQFVAQLELLSKQGAALSFFEGEMECHDPVSIREDIDDLSVSKGDIIWQGSAGLCVTLEDSKYKDQLQVLSMQRPDKISTFRADKIIPLKSLLDNPKFFSLTFNREHKSVLNKFFDRYSLINIEL